MSRVSWASFGLILSNIIMSAPFLAAMTASSAFSTSISIFLEKLTFFLALFKASSTEPTTAMWLSLIRTISSSADLWGSPPPMEIAILSNFWSAGAVFLVPATLILSFISLTLLTILLVLVATPDILIRRLSAVLSNKRIFLAFPSSSKRMSPFLILSPSSIEDKMSMPYSSNIPLMTSIPASIPSSLETNLA